jgi:hypothetical protein
MKKTNPYLIIGLIILGIIVLNSSKPQTSSVIGLGVQYPDNGLQITNVRLSDKSLYDTTLFSIYWGMKSDGTDTGDIPPFNPSQTVYLLSREQFNSACPNGKQYIVAEVYSDVKTSQDIGDLKFSDSKQINNPTLNVLYDVYFTFTIPSSASGTWSISTYAYCSNPSMVSGSITQKDFQIVPIGCQVTNTCANKQCNAGDVWCYDNCGNLNHLFDDCSTGEVCNIDVCVSPSCPTCPSPGQFTNCVNGQKTRTNYKCDITTNWQCQAYAEVQACQVCPNGYCEGTENHNNCPSDCPNNEMYSCTDTDNDEYNIKGTVTLYLNGVVEDTCVDECITKNNVKYLKECTKGNCETGLLYFAEIQCDNCSNGVCSECTNICPLANTIECGKPIDSPNLCVHNCTGKGTYCAEGICINGVCKTADITDSYCLYENPECSSKGLCYANEKKTACESGCIPIFSKWTASKFVAGDPDSGCDINVIALVIAGIALLAISMLRRSK